MLDIKYPIFYANFMVQPIIRINKTTKKNMYSILLRVTVHTGNPIEQS